MEVGATELGAVLVLRERLRWERWVAALVGASPACCAACRWG